MANFIGALKQSILEELAMDRQNTGKDIVNFQKTYAQWNGHFESRSGKYKTENTRYWGRKNKSGANLRDELIRNSHALPFHINPERIISEQQWETEFFWGWNAQLTEIIKISLRNQMQNQATNQAEHDVIKSSKASYAQWQEIPLREREPIFKTQKQPQRNGQVMKAKHWGRHHCKTDFQYWKQCMLWRQWMTHIYSMKRKMLVTIDVYPRARRKRTEKEENDNNDNWGFNS